MAKQKKVSDSIFYRKVNRATPLPEVLWMLMIIGAQNQLSIHKLREFTICTEILDKSINEN